MSIYLFYERSGHMVSTVLSVVQIVLDVVMIVWLIKYMREKKK